jgi:hypothetical protein
MIIRREPDGAIVVDRAGLAHLHGLKPETIRKQWTPHSYDPSTRAALYRLDEDQIDAMRAKTRTRRRRAA